MIIDYFCTFFIWPTNSSYSNLRNFISPKSANSLQKNCYNHFKHFELIEFPGLFCISLHTLWDCLEDLIIVVHNSPSQSLKQFISWRQAHLCEFFIIFYLRALISPIWWRKRRSEIVSKIIDSELVKNASAVERQTVDRNGILNLELFAWAWNKKLTFIFLLKNFIIHALVD